MATLLDTFVSVFTSDTDGLRQGREEARRSTDDIVRGMKEADEQANKTSASVGSMLTKAVAGIASLMAARRGLQAAMSRSDEIHLMNQTAQAIGTNVTKMDAFSKAIQDSGGQASAAQSTIEAVYRSMGRAAMEATGRQAQAFAQAGITLRDAQGEYRDTMDVMLELSDAMQRMGGPEAEALAQRLGITDRRTIETMIQGRQELERVMRAHIEYGAVTQEAAERAAALDSANNYLNQGLGALRDRLVVAVLPAITWVIEQLGQWVRWIYDNQDLVSGFFIFIASIVARHFLPVMVSAAASVWALIAPFAVVGAVILGLGAIFALIYDDVINFIRGNDSLIGQISEKYPAIGRAIERFGRVVSTVFNAVFDIVKWVGEQFDISIDGMMDVVRLFIRLLLGSLDQVLQWGEDFVDIFRNAADSVVAIFRWLGEQIERLLQPIRNSFEWVGEGVDKVRGWLPGGSTAEPVQDAPGRTSIDQGPLALPDEDAATTTRPSQPERDTVARPSQPERDTVARPSQPERDTVARPLRIERDTVARPSQPERDTVARPSQPERDTVARPLRIEEWHMSPIRQDQQTVNINQTNPPPDSPLVIDKDVLTANQYITNITNEPMNNITRENISNQYRNTENNVNIGDVYVQTQATDARGISEAVGGELREQMRMANSEFATGIDR